MAWFYRLSNFNILGRICHIPHRSFYDNSSFVVFLPRTRERNSKKIFLATNNCGNNRSRPWSLFDIFVLGKRLFRYKTRKHKIKIPRTGIFLSYYSTHMVAYVVALSPPTGICTFPFVTVTLPSV